MEVHRPKSPIHGLRELAKEVGIIVLGVLIALAAEQAVEWLHWRERAAQAEVQMRQDATVVLRQMLERQDIQTCQDRLLVRIRDRLVASGADWTPMAAFYTHGPPKGSVYAHPMRPWPETAWRNAVASTAATHLPDAALAHFSHIFDAADRAAQDQAIEHEASSELNALDQHLTLTPDSRLALLRIIYAERARNRLFAYEAGNTLKDFKALGFDVEKTRLDERGHSLSYATCVEGGLN
jgi:hypothetical protein